MLVRMNIVTGSEPPPEQLLVPYAKLPKPYAVAALAVAGAIAARTFPERRAATKSKPRRVGGKVRADRLPECMRLPLRGCA